MRDHLQMKSKLLKDCKTQKEKEQRRQYYQENRLIFEVLRNILKEDLRLIEKESGASARYDDQSWAYKQADYIGCKRTYEEVIELLTIGD